MSNTKYWGEIPGIADTDSGIAALEKEQITKPKPMDVEGHLLHQPSGRHHPPTNEVLPSERFQMDPMVLHTIRLLQYMKKVRAAIELIQENMQKSDPETPVINVGPIPEYNGPPIRDRSNMKYIPQEEYESDFVKGIPQPQPPIDETTCRKLLRRSTAAICAHLSFDTTAESVLDTLTDLCQEYFIQFTKHLGVASDRRAMQGNNGFPDVIERVFHELGVGSVTNLHTFYQQRVLAYHKRVEQQCQAVVTEYNTLVKQALAPSGKQETSSPSGSGDTLHVIRIKEEPQFPLLNEGGDVNEAEQLLNIESLGSFEITVEHEAATGLTTEVDSNRQQGKNSAPESRTPKVTSSSSIDESIDNPPSNQEIATAPTPQSNIPATPQSNAATPRDNYPEDSVIQDPGSISNVDIFSPSISTASKPKKKKKS